MMKFNKLNQKKNKIKIKIVKYNNKIKMKIRWIKKILI